jgi:hypothetical protein
MKLYNNKGFLTFDNKKIYLNFRGTKDIKDVIDNIDIRHQSIIHNNIKVHKGFHDLFFSMEEEITQDIKDILKDQIIDEIVFAGHSNGGSICKIASPYYGELLNYPITTHTFGAVATGNKDFIKWFSNNVNKYHRIEAEGDIIPHIPVHANFYHIPNGFKLKKNGEINTSYNINFYSYLDILKLIIDKEAMQKVYENHCCDNYINSISNINYWSRLTPYRYLD